MPTVYSTYEAKAKFSEILRRVRAGQSISISYRGAVVAEVRPASKAAKETFAERLKRLEEDGILGPPAQRLGSLETVAKRPGALKRFLESRD